jgi:hypothetical protein
VDEIVVSQHFVTFYSPGTFFAEDRTLPIPEWDVEAAKKMAREVVERYNAKPFGFKFSTRSRGPKDLDSKETARSGMHFLGGTIETLKQVEARNKREGGLDILISNMKGNGYFKVITNSNSWRVTQPFEADSVLLDWNP